MWAYRHWRSRFLEEARSRGRVRLSAVSVYRDIEHAALVDDMELQVAGNMESFHHVGPEQADRQMLSALRAHGVAIDEAASNITLRNLTFVRQSDPCYLFCMSTISKVGAFDSPGDVKDAVTFAPDVGELGAALVAALRGEVKPTFAYGPVKYEKRTYEVGAEPQLEPDPFSKPEKFAPDREVRIVIYPVGEIQTHVWAESELLKKLFRIWSDPLLAALRTPRS